MIARTKEFIEFQPFIPELTPNLALPKDIPFDKKGACFERLADKLMEPIRTFPVDADKLANFFHITNIANGVRTTDPKEGGFGGSTLLIRDLPGDFPDYYHVTRFSKSQIEKRFTVAHEAGHVLFLPYESDLDLNATEREDLADSIGRRILAPEKATRIEFEKLKGLDPLLQLAQLYKKLQMPAYELVKRLAIDLKILKGNFLVFSLNKSNNVANHLVRDELFISENTFRQLSFSHTNTSFLYDYLHNQEILNHISAKALVENKEKKEEGTLWNVKVKGITLGNGEGKLFIPEYVIFMVNKLSKIADAANPNYRDSNFKFGLLRLPSEFL